MLYDALKWWQIALSILWLTLILAGITGFVRKPRQSKVRFRTRAIVSLAIIALGAFGFWATSDLLKPAARPLSPPPTDFDARHFDSRDDPAVLIQAPSGWRVELEPQGRIVRVVEGDKEHALAPATLQIESSRLKGEIDTAELLRAIEPKLTEAGFKVDAIDAATIGGSPAQSMTGRIDTRSLTTILVKRSQHYITTLQCFANDGGDSASACAPALAALTWRSPAYP